MTNSDSPKAQRIPLGLISVGFAALALIVGGIAFAGSSGDSNPAKPQEETVVPSGAPALTPNDDSKDNKRGDGAPGSIE